MLNSGNIWDTVAVIAVMLLVIFSAWFVTRFVAERASRGLYKTRYMKLVDRLSLSKDKSVAIIRVGQTDYLIGISGQSITLLDTLELPELPAEQKGSLADAFGAGKDGVLRNRLKGIMEQINPGQNREKRSFSDIMKGKQPQEDGKDREDSGKP